MTQIIVGSICLIMAVVILIGKGDWLIHSSRDIG